MATWRLPRQRQPWLTPRAAACAVHAESLRRADTHAARAGAQGLQQAIACRSAGSIPNYRQIWRWSSSRCWRPGSCQPPPVLSSVQQWEKLMDLAQAAAPKMQQALTDAFDWPKLPSGVQQSLVQGQVAQALAQMADFGMQQMEAVLRPGLQRVSREAVYGGGGGAVASAAGGAAADAISLSNCPPSSPTTSWCSGLCATSATEGFTRAKNLWIPTIEAVREVIRVGLAEGKTTPKIARELRQHIGLLPGQGKQLMAYNHGLIESGDAAGQDRHAHGEVCGEAAAPAHHRDRPDGDSGGFERGSGYLL